jgi:hypothetical protein
MQNPNESKQQSPILPSEKLDVANEGEFDFRDVARQLCRGFRQIFGLALLGTAIACISFIAAWHFEPITTTARVAFSFPGFDNGEYPDGSKFNPDDLLAEDVVNDALKAKGIQLSDDQRSDIRAALTVEGIIPADITKARDRARSLGQQPRAYHPDEYILSLTLRNSFPLSPEQRNIILSSIVETYGKKFSRTYIDVPIGLSNIFLSLEGADYFEYERVLPSGVNDLSAFLTKQIQQAKDFRSPTTNLSFGDLLRQTELFSQIQVNGTLAQIRATGLSRDLPSERQKIDYYLRSLEDREQEALDDEKVIQNLLTATENRSQSYVLGIKSQVAHERADAPILDQGLIDSLIANDAYGMLVRRALDAGLKVKQIEAEKNRLLELKKGIESVGPIGENDRARISSQVDASIKSLRFAYERLLDNVRRTQADFARQQYANAIEITDEISTEGVLRPLIKCAALGMVVGAMLGMGLALLGVYIGRSRANGD